MADEYIKRTLAKAEFTGNFRDEYPTALIHALIDSVPAADVAPVRHGRLLNPNPYGECSLCGHLIDIRDSYNFCPNCGARMDTKEQETVYDPDKFFGRK